MNEALVLGSLRQHELTEAAGALNVQLQEEITQRSWAETLLLCQKQALEMVVGGESLERVLDFLAGLMEKLSRNEFIVAIHLLENDGYHFGRVAAPSLPQSYAHATKGMDARLEMGPCSAAVVARKPTVVRDFAVETRWPAFTAEMASLGLRGCFTTPIVSSEARVVGTIAIYYRQTRDPTPSDEQLAGIMARTASVAIERKQAEDRQSMLINELAHRNRNLLAVVQAIAVSTLSGTRTLAEACKVLTQRIQALARSQSAIAAQQYSGATIADIVHLELEGFSDRIVASGPDLLLDPQRAQTFTLLVHELATNASKYGALSVAAGKVTIRWSDGEPGGRNRFKFRWQESDGPSVVPPTRKGFGRRVLENAVAMDFATLPTTDFAPDGLTYEIDAPWPIPDIAASAESA